jgi:hypothetical protein
MGKALSTADEKAGWYSEQLATYIDPNAWCRIWGIIGPYFIHGTLTGERYRVMLEEDVP